MSEQSQPEQGNQPLGDRIRQLPIWLPQQGLSALLVLIGLIISVVIRAVLLDFHSGDMDVHFLPLCDSVARLGLAQALAQPGVEITLSHTYLVWVMASLPDESRVLALKAIPIFCDYLCALLTAVTLRQLGGSWFRALMGAFCLLLAPTIVFNSALWGQFDMLFAMPLLAALALFLRGKPRLSVALFGVALSVKLQAIFLFPLLAIWLLRKQVPWRSLALIPAVFFASLIPAWVGGVPLAFLLMIYPHQTGRYTSLNLHAPGIYNWLPDDAKWLGPFGIWLTIGITFMLVVVCARRKNRPSGSETLAEAFMFACLLPFLLPRMHERYVFLGDVLSIVYAFVVPRHAWLALLVVGASFFSYFPFLFGTAPVPLGVAAMMLGAACLFLVFVVVRASYPAVFARQAGPSGAGGNLPHDA